MTALFNMTTRKLLESESEVSEDDQETGFKINENYAEKYQNWRKKEEYQKLKDKYGEQVLSEGSEISYSGDSSDDDDPTDEEEFRASLQQEIFDEKFLKVYGALKKKDPEIYDESVHFYNPDDPLPSTSSAVPADKSPSKAPKEKTMTLTDYHVKLVKERKGVTEEDEVENEAEKGPGYYEELYDIKNEFRGLVKEDSDDELFTGLKVIEKPEPSTESTNPLAADDKHIKYLKTYWGKDKEELGEKELFLRDFIVGKKYLDDTVKKPTGPIFINSRIEPEEDGNEDEPVNTFSVPKHHFEEPGSGNLKRFPRIVDSARDLPAKEEKASKRQALKEKKKKLKQDDLKRMTELKRDDLRGRLKKLKEISGNDQFDDNEINLDALVDDDKDFDPSKYDEYMSKLFSDNYYMDDKTEEKPKFEFVEGLDDQLLEEIESRKEALKKTVEAEVGGDEDASDEEQGSSRKTKKGKRKRKEGIIKTHKLENLPLYEDIIGGDLPTRFKYRQVQSNYFGLTNEELVLADDKELNQWVSLKKACQYRNDDEERYDQLTYERKRDDIELKRRIFKSIYSEKSQTDQHESDEEEAGGDLPPDSNKEAAGPVKKKKKRPRKKKSASASTEVDTSIVSEKPEVSTESIAIVDEPSNDDEQAPVKAVSKKKSPVKESQRSKKRNARRKRAAAAPPKDDGAVSMGRLKAYGLSNNQIKRRKLD